MAISDGISNRFTVPKTVPELYERYNWLVRKTLSLHDFEKHEFEDHVQEVWVRWISYDMLGAFNRARSVLPTILTEEEASDILDLSIELLREALPCVHIKSEIYFMLSDVSAAYDLLVGLDDEEPIFVSGATAVLLSGKPWSRLRCTLKPLERGTVTLNSNFMFSDVPLRDLQLAQITSPASYFLDVTKSCFENYLKRTVINILRNLIRSRQRHYKESLACIKLDTDPWELTMTSSTTQEFESYVESREILSVFSEALSTEATPYERKRMRGLVKEANFSDRKLKKSIERFDEYCILS